MKIALITGASSGLGREYALQLHEAFPEVEAVWLIARRRALLDELASRLPIPAVPVALDLTNDSDMNALGEKLKEESPEIELLVNCAGCGYLSNVADTDPGLLTRMTPCHTWSQAGTSSTSAPSPPSVPTPE